MNTSFSWIKDYVPELDCTAQEYMDAMTLSGTKCEGYREFDKNLDKIIVGRINKIEKHPNADHLVVCQVQTDESGTEIQIVTGAPNIKEGDKVPVVLDGGRVDGTHAKGSAENGIKIKKGKLRGVESEGMMCSIDELGSDINMYPDAAKDGIYILSDNPDYRDAPIGSDAVELLGLHDTEFDYEITSNRVDCFAMTGIAREAAATFDKPLVLPDVTETGNDEDVNDYISVEVQNEQLCKRYTARVVKDVHIGPSPEWMKRRLASIGIRPINNLVDITNFVMEEYGQPMHAYDLDTIAGRRIIVRNAEKGDKFVTLDGEERSLDETMLMINDAEKAVGIAGIMGGENSMITDDVKTVLFEAATFDGTNIRLSGKKLGMRTDAQAKFEKGLDPNNAIDAMNRACQLVEELHAGTVVGGTVDIYPVKKEPVDIPYDADKINALLGTDIDEETMISIFEKEDLQVDRDKKVVHIPTFRQDLLRLCDLSEEVARFYGYDKIPMTLPGASSGAGGLQYSMRVEAKAADLISAYGFSEAMTFSFESPKVYDKLLLKEDSPLRKSIRIQNPLGEDYSVMRTTAVGGMLSSLALNYSKRNTDVRLFELANVYIPKELPLTQRPDERMNLTCGMYGDGDFFELKGIINEVIFGLGLRKEPEYVKSETEYLHPGRQADILYNGEKIAYIGEVHPKVLKNYAIGGRAYLAAIDLSSVEELLKKEPEVHFEGMQKFPSSLRDISLVMNSEMQSGDVEKIIVRNGGNTLKNVKVFDVYIGEQLAKGYKSIAYSLEFSAPDRTLTDDEVNASMDKILKALESEGVTLRK